MKKLNNNYFEKMLTVLSTKINEQVAHWWKYTVFQQ